MRQYLEYIVCQASTLSFIRFIHVFFFPLYLFSILFDVCGKRYVYIYNFIYAEKSREREENVGAYVMTNRQQQRARESEHMMHKEDRVYDV